MPITGTSLVPLTNTQRKRRSNQFAETRQQDPHQAAERVVPL